MEEAGRGEGNKGILSQVKKQIRKLTQNKTFPLGVSVMAQCLTYPIRNHEVASLIPGLAQWVGDLALP